MINLMEGAARVAARIQALGAGFDPEVLSLPGGGLIALLWWLYAATVANGHRAAPRRPATTLAAGKCSGGHD
jgi:hypothetical protein